MIDVLIVEDDPMVREINSMFLNKLEGFKLCGAVGRLEEAKLIIKGKNPQLVLLDIFLPNENGLEFIKWIRNNAICCDVVLITADRSSEAVQEAFRYGAIDYLIKPFTFDRFKEALYNYKNRIETFNKLSSVEQEVIDQYVLNNEYNNKNKISDERELELIKGLNIHTYNQIWNYIANNENQCFTAEELSENIGMARVTVRRYLEYMLKEGKLYIKLEYGKIGRPCHVYNILEQKEQNE
ncbi:MAG: response regulator [Clostridium argentinense]|uniref:Transcriptional regulatory protein n=1 Tax=Clostridium faecium TaxID=2762223 RepID=A0ABR8YPE8_9CLOT|nr:MULTISPECIES: response regulator [Clostridium]MBD8046017.1 response regulator [Clostridium faecium]MBS5822866.1 response regulator [Clostridium argentinense]MDU1349121.1 response regulator [Clostridium argentinense]